MPLQEPIVNSISSEAAKTQVSSPISIEVLGVSFTIRTDESPDYIHGLVDELKNRLSAVSTQMKIVDPLKLSLVTCLLALDELHRDKEKKENVTREFEASSLLEDIDKRLGELGL